MHRFFLSLLLLVILSLLVSPALAQTASPGNKNSSLDITSVYEINDPNIENGDILRNAENGIALTTLPYDNKIFGVYQQNPLIVFRNVDGSGSPVLRNGNTTINVTNINGPIKNGDFITTSPIPGKGQKATQSGYIIGVAVEDFDPEVKTDQVLKKETVNGKEVLFGSIEVAVRIEYAEIDRARSANRLLQLADAAFFSTVKDPEQFIRVIRYTGSVLVLIATAGFAYLVFAKSIGNGIQAIGRNPLARRSIQVAIVLNIIFSSVVILLGIVAAFVLLRA